MKGHNKKTYQELKDYLEIACNCNNVLNVDGKGFSKIGLDGIEMMVNLRNNAIENINKMSTNLAEHIKKEKLK